MVGQCRGGGNCRQLDFDDVPPGIGAAFPYGVAFIPVEQLNIYLHLSLRRRLVKMAITPHPDRPSAHFVVVVECRAAKMLQMVFALILVLLPGIPETIHIL